MQASDRDFEVGAGDAQLAAVGLSVRTIDGLLLDRMCHVRAKGPGEEFWELIRS